MPVDKSSLLLKTSSISAHPGVQSLRSGSNLEPPGMVKLRASAVKNDFKEISTKSVNNWLSICQRTLPKGA